jgi:hypothetical protein
MLSRSKMLLAGTALALASGTAAAHSNVSFGFSFGVPYAPAYVAPAPVYYAPRPVYVAPRPVYYAPRPVYYAPRYYYAPAPAVAVRYRGYW